MELDQFSPYIRLAMYSTLTAPFKINERIIFDFELIYLEKGQCSLRIYGRDYVCKQGDVLFIPPDTPHAFTSVGDISVSQPHIHFDVSYMPDSPDVFISFLPKSQMSEKEKSMIRENVLSCLPAPFLKLSDLQYFKGIFFDTIHCYTQQKPFYQLKCKEKMLRLLAYILQENTQLTPKNATDEKMVTLIKDYIDQNFYNIITLEKLELQFSYNKYYIARMFRKKYAQSVMKYYHLLRIAEAKRFLAEGRSVTEISNMLNMSSIYAFSRFFKTYTGKAPSQYNTTVE